MGRDRKPVTVNVSGVGTLYDQSNSPVTGNSQTVVVGADGCAKVTVGSGTPGKLVVTGTTDGVARSVTLSYTGEFVPVSPTRVLDTRSGSGGISGPLSPNTRATFNLTGATDAVPTDARAVAVNVTAVNPGPG